MKNLDLKTLSKGMNVIDKMKILFEDTNLQAESSGKEFLLTPQERDAIIEEARRNGELPEIRRVNELYRTSMFIMIDIEIAQLASYLSITSLEKSVMCIILKSAADDTISEMIYDIASIGNTNQSEIDSKSKELRKKYRTDNILFKGFDFFNPPSENEKYSSTSLKNESMAPNEDIQKLFMLSCRHIKKLKKKLYEMEFIQKKAPFDFISNYNREIIKESEAIIPLFVELNSTLKPLRIYRDYGDTFSGNAKLYEPEFYKTIKNLQSSLELNKEEVAELESKIDSSL